MKKHIFITLALAGALAFSSCTKCPEEPVEEPGDCTVKGTFVKAMCTSSIFDDFSILADGGDEYLVPCVTTVGYPTGIKEGDPVTFSYEVLPNNEQCRHTKPVCTAIPDKPVKFVRITCISTDVNKR